MSKLGNPPQPALLMPRKISSDNAGSKIKKATRDDKDRAPRRAVSLSPQVVEEVKEELEEAAASDQSSKAVTQEESMKTTPVDARDDKLTSDVESVLFSCSDYLDKNDTVSSKGLPPFDTEGIHQNFLTTTTTTTSPTAATSKDASLDVSPTHPASQIGGGPGKTYNSLPRPAAQRSISRSLVPQLRRMFERARSCEPEVLSSSPPTPTVRAKQWLKKKVQQHQQHQPEQSCSKDNVSDSSESSSVAVNQDSKSDGTESVSSFVAISRVGSSSGIGEECADAQPEAAEKAATPSTTTAFVSKCVSKVKNIMHNSKDLDKK